MKAERGVRIVLDRDREEEGQVGYRVEIDLAPSAFRGRAAVARVAGEVVFDVWEPEAPPDWAAKLARAFLRTAWSATRKASAEPWPRRIVRWRPRPA